MFIIRALLLCLLLAGFARTSHAGLVYAFDQTNYNVAPGAEVDVEVFLTQVAPTAGDSADLTVDGLISGGVRVVFNDPTPTDPAKVLQLSHITPNPAFDESSLEVVELNAGVSAGVVDAVDLDTPALLGSSISLGTFRFTAGLVPGEVTTISAVDFSGLDETVAGNFAVLDSEIGNGSATITVAAVPEPSTLPVLAVGALAAARRWRKRRRLAAAEQVATQTET